MTGHNTWTRKSDGTTSQTKPDPYVVSDWLQEATIKITDLNGISIEGTAIPVLPEGTHEVTYDSVNDTTAASVTYQIVNDAGVELPESGGPGTIWMYLLGSLLLVGCGIVLTARRRIQGTWMGPKE